MTPALFIRRHVFGCENQEDFATICRTSQVSVSRWEKRGRIPGIKQEIVRDEAVKRGLEWNDGWFFQVPEEHAETTGQ